MNSKNKTGSINAFDFDLGLSSSGPKPMRDNKNQSSSYYPSTANQNPRTTSPWTQQPNKPAWSHQPVGSLPGPTSMVGDISGRSWNSTPSSNPCLSGIGIVNSKNPNLFSDLLGSAIGQNKSSSNVPFKNAGQGSFSMESVADSMPKYGNSWGSSVSSGGNANVGDGYGKNSSLSGGNVNLGVNSNKNPNLGGPYLKNMGGSGIGGGGMGLNKDPFGSLVDFSTKPQGSMNPTNKATDNNVYSKDTFGYFQNATWKPSDSKFSPFEAKKADAMGDFLSNNQNKGSSQSPGTNNLDPIGDFMSNNQNKGSSQSSGTNNFDALFSSPSDSGMKGSEDVMNQQFSGTDDWDFGGGDDGAGTTELEGLPPPPPGVTASSAKNKGTDNYKQGQFADAIKWLSWAVILFGKAGDGDGTMNVLTCRASCYKEVGEYKKAVADCTKVLEHDGTNVSVLVQRALLYESMEKYKLGAEDLRTVMKLDSSNRLARSTIHRLTKMADL